MLCLWKPGVDVMIWVYWLLIQYRPWNKDFKLIRPNQDLSCHFQIWSATFKVSQPFLVSPSAALGAWKRRHHTHCHSLVTQDVNRNEHSFELFSDVIPKGIGSFQRDLEVGYQEINGIKRMRLPPWATQSSKEKEPQMTCQLSGQSDESASL